MRNKSINNWIIGLVGLSIFLIVAGLVGQADYEDALVQERAYCEQVDLFKQTNGEKGWPDYNENYNSVCAKYDRSVSNR